MISIIVFGLFLVIMSFFAIRNGDRALSDMLFWSGATIIIFAPFLVPLIEGLP